MRKIREALRLKHALGLSEVGSQLVTHLVTEH